MSKPLPVRTSVERIFNIKISTSLPNVDKVAMLEWMLTQPASEINRINTRSETPAFIGICAELLLQHKITEYMQILSLCRNMAVEDAQKSMSANKQPLINDKAE